VFTARYGLGLTCGSRASHPERSASIPGRSMSDLRCTEGSGTLFLRVQHVAFHECYVLNSVCLSVCLSVSLTAQTGALWGDAEAPYRCQVPRAFAHTPAKPGPVRLRRRIQCKQMGVLPRRRSGKLAYRTELSKPGARPAIGLNETALELAHVTGRCRPSVHKFKVPKL
jgi:hypothetical protein